MWSRACESQQPAYAFRARDVTIHARTADLRGFLHDLGGLEHQVLVLRFDIEVDPRTWTLQARLVLVF